MKDIAPTNGTPPLIARRRVLVVLIYMLSVFWGIEVRLGPDPLAGFLISLGGATLMAQFCMIDARVRGHPLPWSVPWLFFSFWPLAVPSYLFWSRGVRRFYAPILYILAFLACPYLGYACAWLATTGLE
jgi:hypothetical protein